MGNQFIVGMEMFIGSIDSVFDVKQVTEKAIFVECCDRPKCKGWIPKSGLINKGKHKDAHNSTPNTYKVAKWVKLNF